MGGTHSHSSSLSHLVEPDSGQMTNVTKCVCLCALGMEGGCNYYVGMSNVVKYEYLNRFVVLEYFYLFVLVRVKV